MAEISFDDLVPKTENDVGAKQPPDVSFSDLIPEKSFARKAGEAALAFGRSAYEAIPFRKDVSAARQMASETAAAYRKAVAEVGEEEAKRRFYAGELSPDFADVKKRREDVSAAVAEEYPISSLAGTVAGAVATPSPFGKYGALEKGIKGVGKRIVGGGAGSGIVGGLSGLGEGTTVEERLKSAAQGTLLGTAFGSAAPAVISGISGAARLASDKFVAPIRGLYQPTKVAEEKVSRAITAPSDGMSPTEFQSLSRSGEPVMIGDVGGEPVKAVARSAANVSSEARQTLNKEIVDRFGLQAARVEDDVSRFFPSRPDYADDLEALGRAARAEKKPAYDRAYEQGASNVFSSKLWDLTKAPSVRRAIIKAERLAGDIAAAEGRKPIINPFTFDKNGSLIAKPGAKASDVNLHFWDAVKQKMDDEVNSLYRSGNSKQAGAIADVRNQLRDELDKIVPSYPAARGTAAKWFGAEDAYEAGINFRKFNDPKKISEAVKEYRKFSDAERELFARGYSFDLLGEVNKVRDNQSILSKNFLGTSPAVRAKNLMALGPERAAALESRLRIESIMDRLRTSVQGGSTTARQIMEYGLAGAATGTAFGGNPYSPEALAGIAIRAGKGQGDARVAKEVAKLLTSKDPDVLAKLTAMAAREPRTAGVLRAIEKGIGKSAGVIAAKNGQEGEEADKSPGETIPTLTIRR